MKKLGKIEINSERIMGKDELKQLLGGVELPTNGYFWCVCKLGVPDNWFKCYLSFPQMQLDIDIRCGNWGGGCSYLWDC
jgi:hypothetical protein